MTVDLQNVLLRLSQLHAELDDECARHADVTSMRGLVVLAYCSIVRQHVLSQHQLLSMDLDVTAMTLVRPAFESLVRAIWSLDGARDAWISRFLAPPGPDVDARDETITGPPVESMLTTISERHPPQIHRALAVLKEATWKPMHSYVHGGIRPVVQILAGCPDEQKIAVARNASGFLMFATNVRQIASGAKPGGLATIQARYVDCLPPA